MGLPELTFSLKKAADTVASRVSAGSVAMILRDAKANGVYKGRKSLQPPEFEKVTAKWRNGQITAAEAMRQLGMSKSTFYRRVKEQSRG